MYEIDLDVTECLLNIGKEDRLCLSMEAERENKEILQSCHPKILQRVLDAHHTERISLSYTGTDNVSIFVREKEHRYMLFSGINPWLESADFADRIKSLLSI